MWEFFKKIRITDRTLSKKERIKRTYLLHLKHVKNQKKNIIDHLWHILRVFIQEYYNINVQFTNDELIELLKNKKIKQEVREELIRLHQEIENIQFSSQQKFNKKDLIQRIISLIKSH